MKSPSFAFYPSRKVGEASWEHLHRIQLMSLLAYKIGPIKRREAGCLRDYKVLQQTCPWGYQFSQDRSRAQPFPAVDPKDCDCSPSLVKPLSTYFLLHNLSSLN